MLISSVERTIKIIFFSSGSAAYKCHLRHGTKCIITGFGETRKSNYNSQLILQHTTVKDENEKLRV